MAMQSASKQKALISKTLNEKKKEKSKETKNDGQEKPGTKATNSTSLFENVTKNSGSLFSNPND